MARPRRKKEYCVFEAVAAVMDPGECFSSRANAQKQLSTEVRRSLRRCRREFGKCSQVGSARDGRVEIRIGGRQGAHMFTRFAIRQRK